MRKNSKKSRPNSLLFKTGCFSPEAMFATMAIEFWGAIFVAIRHRVNYAMRLLMALLIFLGIFQMAEFFICEDIAVRGLTWARIGYIAITMLPPLGISLAMAIAGKKSVWAQIFLYSFCVAFIIYFGFTGWGITAEQCQGNYVFFAANNSAMWMYGTYYYVYLGIGTFFCVLWGRQTKDRRVRLGLYWLAGGYAAFIIPTIAVALVDPQTRSSIPSVMCGFAALLAVVLIFAVAPQISQARWLKHNKEKR